MQWNSDTTILVLTAAVVLLVLFQTAFLLGIFLIARKAAKKLHLTIDELQVQTLPILKTTRRVVEDIAPQLQATAANIEAISEHLHAQSLHVQDVSNETLEQLRRQSGRLDLMMTGVLDSVDRASSVAQSVVNVPIRQTSAILHGVRTAVESLFLKRATEKPAHASEDRETFV